MTIGTYNHRFSLVRKVLETNGTLNSIHSQSKCLSIRRGRKSSSFFPVLLIIFSLHFKVRRKALNMLDTKLSALLYFRILKLLFFFPFFSPSLSTITCISSIVFSQMKSTTVNGRSRQHVETCSRLQRAFRRSKTFVFIHK